MSERKPVLGWHHVPGPMANGKSTTRCYYAVTEAPSGDPDESLSLIVEPCSVGGWLWSIRPGTFGRPRHSRSGPHRSWMASPWMHPDGSWPTPEATQLAAEDALRALFVEGLRKLGDGLVATPSGCRRRSWEDTP